jgi:hypothetical protein
MLMRLPEQWTARGKRYFIWHYAILRAGVPFSIVMTVINHVVVLNRSWIGTELQVFVVSLVVNVLISGPLSGLIIGLLVWNLFENEP